MYIDARFDGLFVISGETVRLVHEECGMGDRRRTMYHGGINIRVKNELKRNF